VIGEPVSDKTTDSPAKRSTTRTSTRSKTTDPKRSTTRSRAAAQRDQRDEPDDPSKRDDPKKDRAAPAPKVGDVRVHTTMHPGTNDELNQFGIVVALDKIVDAEGNEAPAARLVWIASQSSGPIALDELHEPE
jgi:hypothetical protein